MPLAVFTRLTADVPESVEGLIATLNVHAYYGPPSNGVAQGALWLDLAASTRLPMVCQRCLKPVVVDIHAAQKIRFVATEAQAAMEDDDCEEDVLALEPEVDVAALLEDELIMGIPIVATHSVCQAEGYQPEPDAVVEAKVSPFAVLASLKKPTLAGAIRVWRSPLPHLGLRNICGWVWTSLDSQAIIYGFAETTSTSGVAVFPR